MIIIVIKYAWTSHSNHSLIPCNFSEPENASFGGRVERLEDCSNVSMLDFEQLTQPAALVVESHGQHLAQGNVHCGGMDTITVKFRNNDIGEESRKIHFRGTKILLAKFH